MVDAVVVSVSLLSSVVTKVDSEFSSLKKLKLGIPQYTTTGTMQYLSLTYAKYRIRT